jgi:hypothetical protein
MIAKSIVAAWVRRALSCWLFAVWCSDYLGACCEWFGLFVRPVVAAMESFAGVGVEQSVGCLWVTRNIYLGSTFASLSER